MISFKEARLALFLSLALMFFVLGQGSARAVLAQDSTPTPTATLPPVGITQPLGGEALQGVVAISGNTQADGFTAVEVSFAYPADPTGTWFLIDQVSQPTAGGQIASWDTTTISDGLYHLRLQVFLADGSVQQSVVENLRVRNYTPIETGTPSAEKTSAATVAATPRPTRTPAVDYVLAMQTLEPLPTNPARLTPLDLRESAAMGVGVVAGVLLAAALYLGLRALTRR